ncbi:E3 SUMO-protein ligase ZBED1-like [Daphnia magna]|uniref:E3 SUMO-protein ligase ZBED1-like n=1 Tax=Daphnia magna TaxID=35525 RepID=UPI001E1BCC7B|nr:E3 SUMO-protein ligase ZBED1-like [Daphnia magna]
MVDKDNYLVGAVSENAYNIVRAVEIVKETNRKWRHIQCFAHSLNLVVKGSIERNHGISSILARSRAIVTFFHQSAKTTSKLVSLCKNRTSKVLAQDVVRWNSMLTMIASLVELKKYVQDSLSSPAIDRSDLDLQLHDVTLVSALELLQPFDEVTTALSSLHYPSISEVIPSIRLVIAFLNRRKEVISCLAQLNEDLLCLLSPLFSITLNYSTP